MTTTRAVDGMTCVTPIRRATRRYWWTWVTVVCFAGTTTAGAVNQPVEVARVKAAFLYNFAKFTQWPPEHLGGGETLSMCVLGDYPVADALEHTIRGRSVEGHPLAVRILKADGALRSCHLLFVGGSEARRSAEILEAVRGASVLSVSDAPSFVERGGVAQLIVEDDHMRFAINVTAAGLARLQMSSRLLSLATIVRDR